MNAKILFGGIVAALFLGSAGTTAALLDDLGEWTDVEVRDENGELVLLQTLEESNPLLVKTQHFLRLNEFAAKPGGGGSDPGTDCESDSYRVAGWYWTKPWAARSSFHASIMSGGANKWDQQVSASISGGVQSGNDGAAGVQDFKNNIEGVNLGSSSTVAVTTTWSYRGSGEAVESDAQYNTNYAWSTSGASNAMDVDSVATHEIGHTFGLNHPSGSGIDCLTMYAYVNYGWTHGRTLGDGDILGIKAVYP